MGFSLSTTNIFWQHHQKREFPETCLVLDKWCWCWCRCWFQQLKCTLNICFWISGSFFFVSWDSISKTKLNDFINKFYPLKKTAFPAAFRLDKISASAKKGSGSRILVCVAKIISARIPLHAKNATAAVSLESNVRLVQTRYFHFPCRKIGKSSRELWCESRCCFPDKLLIFLQVRQKT